MNKETTRRLAYRIRKVADLYSSREEAAKAAEVSYPQFYRYLNGTTKIPLIVAMRLAAPYSVSMDWIATGGGSMFAPSAEISNSERGDLERQVSEHISDCIAEEGLTIPRDKHENLVRTLVDMTTRVAGRDSNGIDLNRFSDVIRLVAAG